MSKARNLQRKSFFVDARALTRAKRLLRVSTDPVVTTNSADFKLLSRAMRGEIVAL